MCRGTIALALLTVGGPIAGAIEALVLVDPEGRAHSLSSHWSERDALFVFVRHFGCVACHEQIERLRARLAELEALSVRVVIVGCASSDELAAWIERESLASLPLTFRTDPTLAVHEALGLYHSAWRTWGPRAALGFLRAVAGGTLPGPFRGAVSQQGGALFVGRDGLVRALARSGHLGDYPSIGAMIDLALAARVADSPLRL